MRQYSLDDIDRMRKDIERRMDCEDQMHRMGGRHWEERLKIVETYLRTYMHQGVDPNEVKISADKADKALDDWLEASDDRTVR